MTSMSPAHPPKPVRLKFRFRLSPNWVERHIVEHGTRPAETYDLEVDLTELDSPSLRKRFLQAERGYQAMPGFPELDAPTEDVEVILDTLEQWLGGLGERQPFAIEMTQWIEAYGSPRLRTAHKRGYKVTSLYARERAAAEFPRYWVDTNGSAAWSERTDPSLAALGAETDERRHAAESPHPQLVPVIVWLREPPRDLDEVLEHADEDFMPGEAILISQYLGRYSLYLPLAHPREEE
jgi:hypothetical protein